MTLRLLIVLLLVSFQVEGVGPFYFSGSGTDGAVGDMAHPWSAARAGASSTNGNEIIGLDGICNGSVSHMVMAKGPAYLHALNPLKCIITSSANSDPAGIGIEFDTSTHSTGIIIHGFKIQDCGSDGISASGSIQCTFEDNWITNVAMFTDPHDGINSSTGSQNTIQRNHIEHVHTMSNAHNGTGHGIYLGYGTNIVRGNVVHDNSGYGIHYFSGFAGEKLWDNETDDNLTWNNWYGLALWAAVDFNGTNPGTNNVIGNTFLDGVDSKWGYGYYTNNIILAGGQSSSPINNDATHPAVLREDYNLGTNTVGSGAHDVVSIFANIAWNSPVNGRWWLTASSTARNAAKSTVFAPVDFFGNAQGSVSDIGFNQYNAVYAADARALYPTPSAGALYWAQLAPDPVITVQPTNKTVYATQSAEFDVSATGTAPIGYFWHTNGVLAGTNGPTLILTGCLVAWSGMSVSVTVSNSVSSLNSSGVTLIVLPDPVITLQPTNTTVPCGIAATFYSTFSHQTAISYQWQRNGMNIGPNSDTMTTAATTAADIGTIWTVTGTDSAGSITSNPATLNVTGCSPVSQIAQVTTLKVNNAHVGP